MESDRQRKCSEASDATRQRSDPSSFDSLMLLGVCTLTLVPQRAFITQHRGRRRQHAVSMEAVSAPQAPPQTVSTDEQHAAFEAIIDRCENFAEDFDGFLRVAEDLREVFTPTSNSTRASCARLPPRRMQARSVYRGQARPSASWRFRGLSQ